MEDTIWDNDPADKLDAGVKVELSQAATSPSSSPQTSMQSGSNQEKRVIGNYWVIASSRVLFDKFTTFCLNQAFVI